MGRDFSQNKFDGTLGEELDRLWAAIKQDQILSSPSVQATRTPSGTTLNGAPKKAGGAVTMPIEENLSGQRWIIDGDHTMDSFPHILQVKSPDGSRSMRALGVPLDDRHTSSTSFPASYSSNVPPQYQNLASVLWPKRVNLIETVYGLQVSEWPNVSTTFPVYSYPSTYNMFWRFGDWENVPWYEAFPGGYQASIYPDGHFAFLQKLVIPFSDQAGVVEYYIRQVMNPQSGLPLLHTWQVASIT